MNRHRASIQRTIARIAGRVGRHELAILACVLVPAGLASAFLVLASEVVEGETLAFDKAILLWLRNPADLADPIGPRWVEIMMRDVTSLGGSTILTLVTLAVAGYFFVARKRGATGLVLVAVSGGMLLSNLLKLTFGRPRPDLVAHAIDVYTSSFPSSHAMLSAVTYLTLGALLARLEPDRRRKAYILVLAALLTLCVGVSRVYLGVHYPTDVMAGWALGAAWAMLCWGGALWLQRRGQVESDGGTAAPAGG